MSETIHREYFEWQEFIDLVLADGKPNLSFSRDGGDIGKYGVNSWKEVVNLAHNGLHVELDIDSFLSYIETDLDAGMVDSFYSTYDVQGDEVDMGRYLAGEPENMMTSSVMKVMRTGRIVSLYVPLSIAGNISSEEMEARGRAIITLIECFRRLQHPMEIWGVLANHDGSGRNRAACLIKLQDATQPLDESRIMFALTHVAMPRGLGWKYKDLTSAKDRKVYNVWSHDSNYGSASRDVMDDDLISDREHSIVLTELTRHQKWTDMEWSAKWIESMLSKIEEGKVK